MGRTCQECGARYEDEARSCAERFATLLALDHSRQEPWGSRHGLAFAAYQLQHAAALDEAAIERCWLLLYRVYVLGNDIGRVTAALRAQPAARPRDWGVTAPRRPASGTRFAVTIADLGEFEASQYSAAVDRWCRAVLSSWGATTPP